MSGGGSKTEYVTATRNNEPPAYIKPFLEYGAQEARNLYQSALPAYYPQSTVVGFAPQQELALRGIEQRALVGSPLVYGAQNAASRTLSGDYLAPGAESQQFASRLLNQQMGGNDLGGLDYAKSAIAGNYVPNSSGLDALTMSTIGGSFLGGNPYLQQAIQNAAQPTIDAVQSQFSAAGRLGSGANMDVLSRNVGQIAQNMAFANYGDERQRQMQAASMAQQRLESERGRQMQAAGLGIGQLEADRMRQMSALNLLGGNYEAERQRQMAAIGMSPQLAAQDYADYTALAGVGDTRRQLAQQEKQDEVNRFNFEQNVQADKLARYMALVGGGQFGSTGTESRPVFSNPMAEGLGLATGAAGLGNMLFGAPSQFGGGGLFRGLFN